ncbi:MAG: double-strand break repair helicase AddA [Alphaproteobacteria bacterium]
MSKVLNIPQQTIDAQHRASDPARSSWASANAGAGKTHVLTSRVARLLIAGTPPAQILCLTFTKAAAAQMLNRLFGLLGRWSTLSDADLAPELEKVGAALKPEDFGAARRLFARALETPGGLKIQTIHAFAQSVLSRFPLEAGLAPGFEVLDDMEADVLSREARDRMLCDGKDPALADALDRITEMLEETGFDQILRDLLNTRLTLEGALDTGEAAAATRARVFKALGITPGTDEDSLRRAALAPGVLPEDILRRALGALQGGSKRDLEQAEKLSGFLAAEDRFDAYNLYKSAFLTVDGDPKTVNFLMTAKTQKAFPGLIDDLLAEQDRIIALEQQVKAAVCARNSDALITVASRFYRLYREAKTRRGVLDFNDLIDHARALLRDEGAGAWVHYKLDQGIDHILVDEAQDTSPAAWEIIRRLADEFFVGASAADDKRTIFAVGDEKQSIYSFQGAEPAGFERTRAHFEAATAAGHRPWGPVSLSLSFRSAPDILQAVDLVFADAESAAMVSAGGTPVRHDPLRVNAQGLVEVWPVFEAEDAEKPDPWTAPVDKTPAASPPARLAARLAGLIAGWIRDGEWLARLGRPVEPGDILILVRRRTDFVTLLTRELKTADVPVAGTDRLSLTDHIAVMDLMALGRFALLPEDDLTLATVLKGPLIGLSEDDLFALAQGRTGRLWTALKERVEEHPDWREAADRLRSVRDMGRRRAPFDFYHWLLSEQGGRRALLARLGPDAADPIEEFLTLAATEEARGVPDLTSFLDRLERSPPTIKRDMETGDRVGGEVRIMTVHGAKGLEAPIVILPDTCTMPDGKQDSKILTDPDAEDGTPPALFWCPSKPEDPEPAAAVRERLSARREAEYRRLLYVAMTRAEDRLYVMGYGGKRARPEACWYNLVHGALAPHASAFDLGEHDLGNLGDGLRLGAPDPKPERPVETASSPAVETPTCLPEWTRRPAAAEPAPGISLAPSHLTATDDPDTPLPALPPADRVPTDRFRRGRLVHKLLQVLPDLAPQTWRDTGAAFLAHPAHRLPLDDQGPLLEEVLGVMEHPEFATLFAPGSQAEVPLAGTVPLLGDAVVIDGQIDRLVVTDTRVQIVDYKTNRPAPTALSGVSDRYVVQMALYRALLTQVFPGHTVDCVLLWTAGPHAMRVPDQDLDQALERLARRREGRRKPGSGAPGGARPGAP